jgi:dipeptidyl-peptidase-4
MKRLNLCAISATLLLSVILQQPASAQTRGSELYDLMGRERLTSTTGNSQVLWLSGGQGYFDTASGSGARFLKVAPGSGEASPIFDEETTTAILRQYAALTGQQPARLPFSSFSFVDDGAAMTFDVDGRHFYYNFSTNNLRSLQRPEVEQQPNTDGLMRSMARSQLWNGTYSPDYTQFAYVKGYDLYVTNTETGEEKRLSHDGNEDTFNGRPNWVYPEEFDQRDAYWFSPDSKKLAYFRSDESAVHKYPILHDLSPEADVELQSYPKAGEPNPTVVLRIVDIESGETVEVQTNSTANNYIVRPQWLPGSNEILLQRLNRRQNVLELLAADVRSGQVRTVLTEEDAAFINLQDDFTLLEDGRRFLWSSERTGYRHLYIYDLDGTEIAQLTDGDWPVNGVVSLDADEEWVYFTGTTELGLETHFFRVRLDGLGFQQLTAEPGSHRINMDPAGRYYVDSYSSFSTPQTANMHSADGTLIRNLMSTNTDRLESLGLETPELVIFKAADGVTDLHGMLKSLPDMTRT